MRRLKLKSRACERRFESGVARRLNRGRGKINRRRLKVHVAARWNSALGRAESPSVSKIVLSV